VVPGEDGAVDVVGLVVLAPRVVDDAPEPPGRETVVVVRVSVALLQPARQRPAATAAARTAVDRLINCQTHEGGGDPCRAPASAPDLTTVDAGRRR
jgi:hypothetical protein